jgi:hypothetical protein
MKAIYFTTIYLFLGYKLFFNGFLGHKLINHATENKIPIQVENKEIAHR